MVELGTALAATAVKSAAGPATTALTRWGKQKYDKFIATYTNALSEYVEDNIKQCTSVKNILYRNQLASTDEKYVQVCFTQETRDEITDSSIISALLHKRHILIRGRGGAGKTMFTKWAVLRIAETIPNHQKIPIFIALRDLPTETKFDTFEEYLFRKISTNRTKTTFNQFLEGLKEGIFILILDAADEIRKESRSTILRKIGDFSRIYPETGMLLTTRDFPEVDTIIGFEQFRTNSLSKNQAIAILEKLDYNESIKTALKDDIQLDKYEKHSFFLENPLLVTILLLTFDQSKDIPTKRSSFYKRAFEALYERHDGAKEGAFSRDLHAGLPMDEFEKVFSTFCYGTYINSIYDFSESELVAFFSEAAKFNEITENAQEIARDAVESACLIVKEGHENVFVHRSFQEDFVAVYIKNYKDADLSAVIAEALNNSQGENTLEFLFEIDQESLEREYILPNLRSINRKLARFENNNTSGIARSMAFFINSLNIHKSSGHFAGLVFGKEAENSFLFSIRSLYPEVSIFRLLFNKDYIGDLKLPIDKISRSRSSKTITRGDDRDILQIRFTPTSSDWLSETTLPNQVKSYIQDLKNLEKRLMIKYSTEKSEVGKRFSSFTR